MFPDEDDAKTIAFLNQLRTGDTIDQLIIIRKLSKQSSLAVIHGLIDVLRQGNISIIDAVAKALAEMGEKIYPMVKTEIYNTDCFIRWGMARTMGLLQKSEFVEWLIPALGLGYSPTQEVIVKTLHQLNPTRFPKDNLEDIFNRLTREEKDSVVKYAIRMLGTAALDTTENLVAIHTLYLLADPLSILPILKVLHHPDFRVQRQAHEIMSTFKESQIFEECRRALKEKDLRAQEIGFQLPQDDYPLFLYAFEGLGMIDNAEAFEIILNFLRSGSPQEKSFAVRGLEYVFQRQPRNHALLKRTQIEIERLLNITSDRPTQINIIQALGQSPENWAVSALILYLKDLNPAIRLSAVEALSTTARNKEIIIQIAQLLIDPEPMVRRATVSLFWKIDPDHFFGYNEGDIIQRLSEPLHSDLLNRLTSSLTDASPDYKEFAIFWLGLLRYEPAYSLIVKSLHGPFEKVVITAIGSLGLFGNRTAITDLLPFIYAENRNISQKTIETIGSLGLDGLYTLIHELFQRDHNPPFLESFISSFGGRVLSYLLKEIENEKRSLRRGKLQSFYSLLQQKYHINNPEHSEFLL